MARMGNIKQEDGKMVTNRISQYIDNVVLKDVMTVDGMRIPGRKAVVDQDSKRVLGEVSSRYKVVKNSDLLKAIMPHVEELGLHTQPQVSQARGGAITYFKFLGEKLKGEIKKGDIVRFGLEFFNSYDGSTEIGFHAIAEQLKCTNGLVVPHTITHLYMRHTSGANAQLVGDRLADYSPKVSNIIKVWQKWVNVRPTPAQLEKSLEGLFAKKHIEEFMGRFNGLKENDRNVWGWYDIVTYYMTHQMKTRKEDKLALKRFELGEDVSNRLEEMFTPQLVS
jgi:hypothetical protein